MNLNNRKSQSMPTLGDFSDLKENNILGLKKKGLFSLKHNK